MTAKPRIFIHMHYLELGGAEMALIGLLNAIDTDKYDVDLFLNQHTGVYMDFIPKGINLLPEISEYAAIEQPLSASIKRGRLKCIWNKLRCHRAMRKYLCEHPGYGAVASHIYMNTVIKSLPSLNYLGEYDLAISFLDPPHVVQDKVLAKKKIEWIHTDFSAVKYDGHLTEARWQANDYIISISDSVSESFSKIFPQLQSKLYVIENIISPEFVRQRAKLYNVEIRDKNKFIFCSIGRLTAEQKNFIAIPKITKILKAKGLRFKWLIIGPGDDSELRRLISENDVADVVELTGPQDNPYPYIANCDIYVQPSLFEGKSIAVREAQILCKPVIITNYPTSASQIINGVDGIICEMDNESIVNCIYELISNKKRMRELSHYLSTHDYGLKNEVEKLYELI